MNYTSIEQSKKLLELGLNPESADMYYMMDTHPATYGTYYELPDVRETLNFESGDLPCWSVGALHELLPSKIESKDDESDYSLSMGKRYVIYDRYNYDTDMNEELIGFCESTIVESLINMVVWLLENNYIKH